MRQIKSKQKNRIWWDNARIGTENDKRRHITDDDKEYMRQLYEKENLPIREIARIFEGRASRRAIQFVLFPERLAIVKARAIEVKRWEPYNTKEIRLEAMRKYRAHIRKVHKLPTNNN